MRYDLKSEQLDYTFYIQCSVANKPTTLKELIDGICEGKIIWQPDFETPCSEKLLSILGDQEIAEAEVLETDFSTCKPIRHNINWPRTEDMK